MIETERLRAERLEIETRLAQQRRENNLKLAHDFESAIGEIIEGVSSAATELEASAGESTGIAQQAVIRPGKPTTASVSLPRRQRESPTRQSDQHHRRPDQPTGSERHNRGGARG
jgi:hypothetical protein